MSKDEKYMFCPNCENRLIMDFTQPPYEYYIWDPKTRKKSKKITNKAKKLECENCGYKFKLVRRTNVN